MAADEEKHVETITLDPVGIIKNDLLVPPLIAGEDGLKLNRASGSAREELNETSDRISEIVLAERFTGLLDGIEEYSHVIVLYWGHEIPGAGRLLEKIHPA